MVLRHIHATMLRFVGAQRFAAGSLLLCLAAGAAFAAPPAESIRLKSVAFEAMPCRVNLLSNPSLEQTDANGLPSGWQWDRRNTDATCVTDHSVSHSGRKSIRMTNGTAFGPHVYGTLWRAQPVRVTVGKPYTMSAWVKSEQPGRFDLIAGQDWLYRVHAVAGGGQWRRIWGTFTPGAKDRDLTVRINLEHPTHIVWIDDVKLEEGASPTFDPPGHGADAKTIVAADEQEMVVPGDGPFSLAFSLVNPRAVTGTLKVALSSGQSLRQPISRPARGA